MLWAAVALMMMTACSSDGDELSEIDEPIVNPENNEQTPISLTRAEQQLVTGNNDFAFNLFRLAGPRVSSEPAGQEPEKSTILSPISITYALGMLNNGAAGETLQQINKVLGFNNADEVNAFCKKMLTEALHLDKLTKVQIANNIYVNKDYTLNPVFVEKANDFYDAQPETRDFADGKTRDVINQWASDHTEKMIEEVLSEDEFKPNAVSYLLNAIYFKGTWEVQFKKEETKEEAFKSTGKNVPMMHMEQQFLYADKGDYEALKLPYGNGAYSMTILLPKDGKSTYDIAQGLTAESWKSMWKSGVPSGGATVDVKLPRFETNTDLDLVKIMSRLGMPKAFTVSAEFPDFCNTPTFIGLMKQVARIKVSEEGTEAAAVTVIGMKNSVTPSEPIHVNFHADHPFIYIISEQSTGAIFFIGHYTGL
jgi:serpin B